MFDEAREMVAEARLSAATHDVLQLLPSYLDWKEWRTLPTPEIAKRIRRDGSAISRAMKDLQRLGLVEKQGKGPTVKWRLSTLWGWRGDVDSFNAANGRGRAAEARERAQKPQSIAAEYILWKLQ